MHTRPWTYADIPHLTSLTMACDVRDALANYLVRDTAAYPTSHRRGIHMLVRGKLVAHTLSFVLETDEGDYPSNVGGGGTYPGHAEVVGLATWRRLGTSDAARRWQARAGGGLLGQSSRVLWRIEDRYNACFPRLNPCFRPAHLANVLPITTEPWDPEVLGEAWVLEFLQVHPDWQRRGLSQVLLRWGLERAQEETVPCCVSASPVGNYAYRRAGFQSIGVCGYSRWFDELEWGGELMQLWVWEPRIPEGRADGVDHGRWAVRARRNREERLAKAAAAAAAAAAESGATDKARGTGLAVGGVLSAAVVAAGAVALSRYNWNR